MSLHYPPAVLALGILALVAVVMGILALIRSGLKQRTALSVVTFPAWDGNDSLKSLNDLFQATIAQGDSAIGWYKVNVRGKRVGSQILRSAAIILATVGALLPLIVAAAGRFADPNSWTKNLIDAQWGYIAFATAAACVAADKFYGMSSCWIRYMKTQLVLEGALTDLRYDWFVLLAKVEKQQPTPEQVQAMLQKMKDFVVLIHTQIQQETDAWVLEFQANLADLSSTVRAQRDAQKAGSVQVIVPNTKEFDGGVNVQLDHSEDRTVEGTQCLFASVSPGAHEILITGKKANQLFRATNVVKVAPDSMASVSIPLPIS